jgi:hypothetical protein
VCSCCSSELNQNIILSDKISNPLFDYEKAHS